MQTTFAPNLAELDCFKQARQSIDASISKASAVLADIRDARIAEYRTRLARHDWHYEMSDDYSSYKAGQRDRREIDGMRLELDADFAIWNEVRGAK